MNHNGYIPRTPDPKAPLRGFFHEPSADPEQYIFGSTSPIQSGILQPDRDWRPFLIYELQNGEGYDPLVCASINTERAVQGLIKRQYGEDVHYSERWLAYQTDTHKKGGNDPHYVLEFWRKNGIPLEEEWPSNVPQERYFDTPPDILWQSAKDFLKKWVIKHDTIRGGAEEIWDALQYCPVPCSVGWNRVDENGYWYKDHNGPDTHWSVVACGGEYGKYLLFMDSAEPIIKKARWDMKPQLAKRVAVFRAPTQQELSYFARFIQSLLDWLNGPRTAPLPVLAPLPPVPPPEPLTPKRDLLTEFCEAIKTHEGWSKGSRSYRNNNPGNCRFSRVGYYPRYEPVREDRKGVEAGQQGFAIFKDYETGYLYMKNLILEKVRRHPNWTIHDFIADEDDGWAPASDKNNTVAYSNSIAKKLGVDASSWQIKNLIP